MAVGRCRGGSGCVLVLVDESVVAAVSSDRLAGPVRDDFGSVPGALAERAVGSVLVVVLDVRVEESLELLAVPDGRAVEQLATHASGAGPCAPRSSPPKRVRAHRRSNRLWLRGGAGAILDRYTQR